MSNTIFYTQSIADFLTSHLRADEKYPISQQQAEILSALCQDKFIIHIQYPEPFSIDQNIYLWRYADWKVEKDNLDRLSRMSHATWIKQQIFLANVDMIATALKEKGYPEEKSRSASWKWLKEGNTAAIKMVAGIEKLKEKEEEI